LHENKNAHPRRTGWHLAVALLDLPGRGGRPAGLFRRRADGHPDVRRERVHERPAHEAGPAAFQSNALDGSTPQESKSAFDSYLSYFGRYWYDPERQAVVHKVEASLIPNWVGQEQVRYVRLEGRKLCIYTPPFLADGPDAGVQHRVGKVVTA
jgi:hypothetical protein